MPMRYGDMAGLLTPYTLGLGAGSAGAARGSQSVQHSLDRIAKRDSLKRQLDADSAKAAERRRLERERLEEQTKHHIATETYNTGLLAETSRSAKAREKQSKNQLKHDQLQQYANHWKAANELKLLGDEEGARALMNIVRPKGTPEIQSRADLDASLRAEHRVIEELQAELEEDGEGPTIPPPAPLLEALKAETAKPHPLGPMGQDPSLGFIDQYPGGAGPPMPNAPIGMQTAAPPGADPGMQTAAPPGADPGMQTAAPPGASPMPPDNTDPLTGVPYGGSPPGMSREQHLEEQRALEEPWAHVPAGPALPGMAGQLPPPPGMQTSEPTPQTDDSGMATGLPSELPWSLSAELVPQAPQITRDLGQRVADVANSPGWILQSPNGNRTSYNPNLADAEKEQAYYQAFRAIADNADPELEDFERQMLGAAPFVLKAVKGDTKAAMDFYTDQKRLATRLLEKRITAASREGKSGSDSFKEDNQRRGYWRQIESVAKSLKYYDHLDGLNTAKAVRIMLADQRRPGDTDADAGERNASSQAMAIGELMRVIEVGVATEGDIKRARGAGMLSYLSQLDSWLSTKWKGHGLPAWEIEMLKRTTYKLELTKRHALRSNRKILEAMVDTARTPLMREVYRAHVDAKFESIKIRIGPDTMVQKMRDASVPTLPTAYPADMTPAQAQDHIDEAEGIEDIEGLESAADYLREKGIMHHAPRFQRLLQGAD